MIFQNPQHQIWFLLLPLAVGIYLVGRHFWHRFGSASGDTSVLRQQVLARPLLRHLRFLFVLLAIFFMVVALMRPRWGARDTGETELGIDVAIVVDISRSMLARDITPSRLERVVAELAALLPMLEGNRFSLVLFAGAGFIQCPLTADIGAIRSFLEAASPAMISLQGTNIADALENALRSLQSKFKRNRIVLLVSDGEAHEGDAVAAAARLYRDNGVRVFTVGVGTGQGAGVFDGDSEKRDQEGKPVLSKLDADGLGRIATAGGGATYTIGNERFDTAALARSLDSIEKSGLAMRRPETLVDRYPVFVFAAFLLLTAAILFPERRKA